MDRLTHYIVLKFTLTLLVLVFVKPLASFEFGVYLFWHILFVRFFEFFCFTKTQRSGVKKLQFAFLGLIKPSTFSAISIIHWSSLIDSRVSFFKVMLRLGHIHCATNRFFSSTKGPGSMLFHLKSIWFLFLREIWEDSLRMWVFWQNIVW